MSVRSRRKVALRKVKPPGAPWRPLDVKDPPFSPPPSLAPREGYPPLEVSPWHIPPTAAGFIILALIAIFMGAAILSGAVTFVP